MRRQLPAICHPRLFPLVLPRLLRRPGSLDLLRPALLLLPLAETLLARLALLEGWGTAESSAGRGRGGRTTGSRCDTELVLGVRLGAGVTGRAGDTLAGVEALGGLTILSFGGGLGVGGTADLSGFGFETLSLAALQTEKRSGRRLWTRRKGTETHSQVLLNPGNGFECDLLAELDLVRVGRVLEALRERAPVVEVEAEL